MEIVASYVAVKRIDHKIMELKNSTLAAEQAALNMKLDTPRIVGAIVAAHGKALRELAATLIEMHKLDRTRALFTPKKKNNLWASYATARLHEFLDWGWNRMPAFVDGFTSAPQVGVDAQNRIFNEYGMTNEAMILSILDQHTEAQIKMRNKVIQWIKYAVSAGIGAAGHAMTTHWFGS